METKWDRDLHRAAAVGSTKLLQKTLNTGKVHIDCQDEVRIAISITFFSRQIHSCIITFLMLTQSLVGYGVVIFNALYILCIKILRQKPSFKAKKISNYAAQEMKRKIIPMLMICNSVLETYIGTFFPYIFRKELRP